MLKQRNGTKYMEVKFQISYLRYISSGHSTVYYY